jgi:hypothetical protein
MSSYFKIATPNFAPKRSAIELSLASMVNEGEVSSTGLNERGRAIEGTVVKKVKSEESATAAESSIQKNHFPRSGFATGSAN